MADQLADEFVSGTSVRVRSLVGTIVGGILIAWWSGAIQLLESVMSLGTRLITAPLASAADLLEIILMTPGDVLEAGWSSAAEWLSGLEALGPFVFVIAIAIAFGTLWLLDETLEHMGVL